MPVPETDGGSAPQPGEPSRVEMRVRGVVQGVGFRPTVFRLANEEGLGGFVGNDSGGVVLEVEGTEARIDRFAVRLRAEVPPLAQIDSIVVRRLAPLGESKFRIIASHNQGTAATGIPPDAATCADCLRELFDPLDRRFRYPFLNCTNCGPRYTITRHIPYDRPQTSMAPFTMCAACQAEYDAPGDRRFHAQPNACLVCGPRLTLVNQAGEPIPSRDVVTAAIQMLCDGQILAIKGVGGFHLAVDARNESAVGRLRLRKHRHGKPLAVMVRSVEQARQLATLSAGEVALLTGMERPIVLVRAGAATGRMASVAANVAPGVPWIGLFLPYAPLHHLLLADERLTALVMTSANLSEEPIAIDNDEALARLGGIADAFLMHNRDILQRCDDSVMAIVDGAPQLIRRARGFVPLAIELPLETPPLVAVGGHLKSVLALASGRSVYQSQHLGDLEDLMGLGFFEEALVHLRQVFDIQPQWIVHDLHPGYLSTEWAIEQSLPRIGVQHHHAHVAGCMAEHGLVGPTIGIALDGTGYGTDGRIWGGEVLIATLAGFERFAHLAYVAMPGGKAAIREPNRMALAGLMAAGIDPGALRFSRAPGLLSARELPGAGGLPSAGGLIERLESDGLESERLGLSDPLGFSERQMNTLQTMVRRGVNAPLTSSCGRLFDAVAALVLGRRAVDYEAQAAIELEGIAGEDTDEAGYPFAIIQPEGLGEPVQIGAAPMWQALVADLDAGVDAGRIAERFHVGVADVWAQVAVQARAATGIGQVVLSGGVFHNRLLTQLLRRRLEREGFEVFAHRRVSPGDGGLSYGQAAVGAAQLQLSKVRLQS